MLSRVSIFFLTAVLAGCGGGSSSPDDLVLGDADTVEVPVEPATVEVEVPVALPGADEALPFDTAVTFLIDGQAPVLVDGPSPEAVDDESRPNVFSAPATLEASSSSTAQVEIAYNVNAPLRALFIDQENVTEHLLFELQSSNDGTTEQESVVFTVDLPIDNETRCYLVSVEDINSLVSDQQTICITALDDDSDLEDRTIYFVDFENSSTLSTLSLDTGDVQEVGATGFRLTDIAFSGLFLYGITGDELIEIDPETGASTSLGSYGLVPANALEGLNGLLYAADVSGSIFSIDPVTVETVEVGTIPGNEASSGDLVVDPLQENIMYGTSISSLESSDTLYSFNVETGETVAIGQTGFNNVWGLAVFRDQLVGLTESGEFILIDRDTGLSALVSQDESLSTAGATVAADF